MKKLKLLFLFSIITFVAKAQFPENFDVSCAVPRDVPSSGWTIYNPMMAPDGQWQCTPVNGRPAISGAPTAGAMCTGVYDGAYHLDTSFLISTVINLNNVTMPYYLQFDAKKENILLGGKLDLIARDSMQQTLGVLDSTLSTIFDDNDSVNWVTYQVDLSSYKLRGSIYVAFRYTSSATSGTALYLDNILLTNTPLVKVPTVAENRLPVTVTGSSNGEQVSVVYFAPTAGRYNIALYDMTGRNLYHNQLNANAGQASYTINGLSLHPGMYCLKMGNETTYSTTKFIIQ